MTTRRTRIFIDFWNFQLSWNDATARARCDWRALPGALVAASSSVLASVGYDVAILLSSDADFVPAVEHIQKRGLKVINAGWGGKGHELKAACWASFDLLAIASTIMRPEPGH